MSSLFLTISKTDIIFDVISFVFFQFYFSSVSFIFSVHWLCSTPSLQKWLDIYERTEKAKRRLQLKNEKIEEQKVGFVCLIILLPQEDNFWKYAFLKKLQEKVLFSLCLTICLPWIWSWHFFILSTCPRRKRVPCKTSICEQLLHADST